VCVETTPLLAAAAPRLKSPVKTESRRKTSVSRASAGRRSRRSWRVLFADARANHVRHEVTLVLPLQSSTSGRRELCYLVDTMSNSVGIRELRQQASAVLRRVVAGEVIEVTEHGHPIARIVPLRRSVLDQLVIEGRASEAEGDLLEVMGELGLPGVPELGCMSPSQALAELRADER
jgi:prevent-host-death family protein